uniref:Carbohydrate sulfotransferase n=1 Tax=Oryzias latipes TaxID=8090 RepID=A0A3P9HLA7_ORYLA
MSPNDCYTFSKLFNYFKARLLCWFGFLLLLCSLSSKLRGFLGSYHLKSHFNHHLCYFKSVPFNYHYAILAPLPSKKKKAKTNNCFRKDLLRKYCEGGNQSLDDLKESNLTNVIVDDKHGIIYCYIPKVACTNWKRTLIALNYSEPYPDPMSFEHNWVHDSERFQYLNDFPKAEREAKLKHYTKFLFVRDPFVRLISAYRDKMQNYNQYFYEVLFPYAHTHSHTDSGSAAKHWRQLQPPGAMWGFSVLSMDTLTHRQSRRKLNLRLSD